MSEKEKNQTAKGPEQEMTDQAAENKQTEVETPQVDKNQAKKTETAEKTEMEQLQDDYAALNDRFLRTVAEYDNYRKRTDREKLASAANGCCSALERMLPALDTLEAAASAESIDADYKKGVQMTVELFKAALAALDVTEIETAGKPFDPELHYAVSREQKEGIESGTVVTVLQKGYKMGDRIVRHAMVTVAE